MHWADNPRNRSEGMFRAADDMLPPQFRDPIMDPETGKWLYLQEKPGSTGENSGPIGDIGCRKNQAGESANGWIDHFLDHEFPEMGWLIEPMIPSGGIVFLHGPTSAGKSPFTWALAASVATGTPFGGYPVKQPGPVLYIELDTPSSLIQPRLKKLSVELTGMPLWMEVFRNNIDIVGQDPEGETAQRLHLLQRKVKPVMVVVNTLRKAHSEDDKDSATPSKVYGAWRDYFPYATLFFVHHDKKSPPKEGKGSNVDEDQMFSGSQHWSNDAQIAFHLMRAKPAKGDEDGEYKKTPITVKMTKSQVSDHENFPPLQMRLDADGTNWQHTGPSEYRTFFQAMPPGTRKKDRIRAITDKFGIGESAAYAACTGLKAT